MQRTFVMGDLHGAYRALRQCLQKSAFDYNKDLLIFLGDVADGWPETRQCIDELLKIKNLIYCLGNHDFWTIEWMETGFVEELWFDQGGKATLQSYGQEPNQEHLDFLKKALPYHLSEDKLFVHAGINTQLPLERQSLHNLIWDRSFARTVLDLHNKPTAKRLTSFEEIYVGHTPIPNGHPIQVCEVWFMDTGAGWSGVLSMMDVHTKKVFSSDPVPALYPEFQGRQKK